MTKKHLSANIHRALARLKSLSVTLNAPETGQHTETNIFVHPIAVKLHDAYDVSDERSFQLQIGSKTMPEYPMTSVTEAPYQLRKTVGNPLHIYMGAGIVLINIPLALIWKRFREQGSLVFQPNQVIN